MPQGSLCGPALYLAYASRPTIQEVVPNDIQLHGYVDDHAFQKAFKPTPDGQEETATITDFQQLLATVKNLDGREQTENAMSSKRWSTGSLEH